MSVGRRPDAAEGSLYAEAAADVRLSLTIPAYESLSSALAVEADWERWAPFYDGMDRAERGGLETHFVGGASHVLGHADDDQVVPAVEPGTKASPDDWRLLALFSTETELWIDISDGGGFYCGVPRADCAEGRFDRVRVVMAGC